MRGDKREKKRQEKKRKYRQVVLVRKFRCLEKLVRKLVILPRQVDRLALRSVAAAVGGAKGVRGVWGVA